MELQIAINVVDTPCAFLDLQKAFDTVNHEKLVNSPENINKRQKLGLQLAVLKLSS